MNVRTLPQFKLNPKKNEVFRLKMDNNDDFCCIAIPAYLGEIQEIFSEESIMDLKPQFVVNKLSNITQEDAYVNGTLKVGGAFGRGTEIEYIVYTLKNPKKFKSDILLIKL